MQRISFVANHDGMARIGATVVSDDEVMIAGENIDEFALAFVSPLEAYHGGMTGGGGWHGITDGHGDSEGRKTAFYESRGLVWRLLGADPHSGIDLQWRHRAPDEPKRSAPVLRASGNRGGVSRWVNPK